MTEINREQIILAAYNATGPAREGEDSAQHGDRLVNVATEIYLAFEDRSPISKHLANLAESTAFTAVLLKGGREPETGRGKLILQTKSGDETKQEDIRTDFLNTSDGRRVFDLAKTMKGHRVLVYKQMEMSKDKTKKFRVVRHLVDLGPVEDSNDGS